MTILKDAPGIISPYDGIIFIQATVIKISFRREGEIRMMYCLKNGLIRFAGIILGDKDPDAMEDTESRQSVGRRT